MPINEEAIEREIQAKGLLAPRITPQMVDDCILTENYFHMGQAAAALSQPSTTALDCLTICVLGLKNGYTVTGESACASPANFNAELGIKIARDNARNKIWALEGYRLRSELAKGVS